MMLCVCIIILILKKVVPVECYSYIIAYQKTILYPIVCKNSGPHLNLYKVCADAQDNWRYVQGYPAIQWLKYLSVAGICSLTGNIAFDEVTLCHNLDVESTTSAGYDSNTIVCFLFFPGSKKPPHVEQHTPLSLRVWHVHTCGGDRGSVRVYTASGMFFVSSKNTYFTGRFVPRLLN